MSIINATKLQINFKIPQHKSNFIIALRQKLSLVVLIYIKKTSNFLNYLNFYCSKSKFEIFHYIACKTDLSGIESSVEFRYVKKNSSQRFY